MIKMRVVVDKVDVVTALYDLGRADDAPPVGMDDAGLARVLAAFQLAAAARAATGVEIDVEVCERPPYRRPDPTPAEIAEIDETATRIAETLGEELAEQYKAERLSGGGL